MFLLLRSLKAINSTDNINDKADTDNINNKADKGYNCRIPVECLKISDTHPLFDTQLLDIFYSLLWIIYQKENLGDRILYFGNVSDKLLYYSSIFKFSDVTIILPRFNLI